MINDFQYCDNPNNDVPKMRIDEEIGGKDENPKNIDETVFATEFKFGFHLFIFV